MIVTNNAPILDISILWFKGARGAKDPLYIE